MPRYDYRCNECGNVYEKREGFDAPSVQACPQCAGTARRVLTPPAILFKGSGWYVTDHRKGSDSESPSTGAATSTKADSSKPDGAKADSSSKPAETPKSEASTSK